MLDVDDGMLDAAGIAVLLEIYELNSFVYNIYRLLFTTSRTKSEDSIEV